MSDPFIGEIRMVGFNFAPTGWALCDGQLLPIAQNTALFSLLGTTYGGNGVSTFALPDMRGRAPVHQGQGPGLSSYVIGQRAGTENTTLTVNNLPAHTHALSQANAKVVIGARTDPANSPSPAGGFLATAAGNTYVTGQTDPNNALKIGSVAFGAGAATNATGSNLPVSTLQPYLCINFVIALQGVFPSRS